MFVDCVWEKLSTWIRQTAVKLDRCVCVCVYTCANVFGSKWSAGSDLSDAESSEVSSKGGLSELRGGCDRWSESTSTVNEGSERLQHDITECWQVQKYKVRT